MCRINMNNNKNHGHNSCGPLQEIQPIIKKIVIRKIILSPIKKHQSQDNMKGYGQDNKNKLKKESQRVCR